MTSAVLKANEIASARRLLLEGKYVEAREQYEMLAAEHPVSAAVGLSRALRAVGEDESAGELLNKAIVDHAGEASLHAELASLAFERGDHEQASSSVAAALEADAHQLQARWLEAELFRISGKVDEANAACQRLVDYYNTHDRIDDAESLRWIGLAAARYARWNRLSDQFTFLVNTLYPDALAIDPSFWPARLETGRLYLEKYNLAEASRELQAALAINPAAAEVYAALAEMALERYDLDDADRWIRRALEINPRLIAARQLKADLALANFEVDEAIDELQSTLELNPVSETTLGRLAAAMIVRDGLPDDLGGTPLGELIGAVHTRNPRAGEFHQTLAVRLEARRQFDAAERFFREALDRMPRLVGPRAGLGMMYMRLGREAEARALLEESFEIDPFNVRVSNTLKVLDVLDGYAVLETEHFVIKFDRAQDEVLARTMARYLEEEVYPELCERFDFHPPDKSLFEIFNRARNTDAHGWFSARMVGLPYIGTVGACAGKVVALASPGGMPNKYNWARVVKHEFVHVLNLQQTEFNIPHWFTEALAVLSEDNPRPQIWNELLARRVPSGDVFDLDDINLGFIRPQSSDDWHMAYCQAELYAEFMLETYGADALSKMLAAYRDRLDTRQALERSFGVSQEAFEKDYRTFVEGVAAGMTASAAPMSRKLGDLERALRDDPQNADLLAHAARAHLDRRSYAEARRLAERARRIDPSRQLASYVIARIHLLVGETDEAVAVLEEALDRETPEHGTLNLLAGLRYRGAAYDEAAELYSLAVRRDPTNDRWPRALAAVYVKSGNNARLAEVLKDLARRDPDDLIVRKKLIQLALDGGDSAQAVHWARRALHIDAADPVVREQLAIGLVGTQDYEQAIEEYRAAVQLSPDAPRLRFALAETLAAAGRRDEAREVLELLIEQNPEDARAAELLERIEP